MPTPYRIVDLTTFPGVTTGTELMEVSQAGAQSYQVTLANALGFAKNQITIATAGTYNLAALTYGDILVTTSSAVTVNLPDSTMRNGNPAAVVAAQNTTPNITINPNDAQKVIGQTSLTITNAWGSYNLWPIQSGSGGWYVKGN